MATKFIDAGKSSQYWQNELEATKCREQHFLKEGKQIVAVYRDERANRVEPKRRVNVLWSNTEIGR